MSWLAELKRRNVLRVGAAYVVTSWLVVQVVETVFPVYGLSNDAVRLVITLLGVGLVPTLVLAWVFEWTPEGLKKDRDATRTGTAPAASAQRFDRMIMAVLALAVGYFALDKFVLAPRQQAAEVEQARQAARGEALVESYGEQSIAVLPFTNLSPDPEQEYLGDGLAEEMLNLLARIPELRVTSRTSAFKFKGQDLAIPEIAAQLRVAHVLEGSVRKAGNRVRITAQLIEARSDTHLWSETWDRELDDIFAIQDEIAAEVVDQLRLQLVAPPPTVLRTDPRVHALTLQAMQLIQVPGAETWEQARDLIRQALALDPGYVPALEIQGRLLAWQPEYDQSADLVELERAMAQIKEQILERDPDNVIIAIRDAWDTYAAGEVASAVARYETLVREHPSHGEVLRTATAILRRTGLFEQALALGHRCTEVDPLTYGCWQQLKEAYFYSGRFEQYQAISDQWQALVGKRPLMHDFHTPLFLGQPERTLELVGRFDEITDSNGFRAMAFHSLGDEAAYQAEVGALLASDPHHLMAATVYAWAGDNDAAFEWLDVFFEREPLQLLRDILEPAWWKLHDDPRWDELRERVGFTAADQAALSFEVPPGWDSPEALNQ